MTRRLIVLAIFAATVAHGQTPRFEPVAGVDMSLGTSFTNAWADFDGDGRLDLFVGFNGTPNRLYKNEASGLRDVAASVGVADARATRSAAWGDYDGDGDPDLLLGFTAGEGGVLRLYRNDRGKFIDVTSASGLTVDRGAVRQPVWVDFDGDNDLDLFIGFRDRANALFVNDGGRFADRAAERGLADTSKTVGAVWFDVDEDGDLDVMVANMDGQPNTLYQNASARFTLYPIPDTLFQWGGRAPRNAANGSVRTCTADVDNDGRLDLFFANYGPNGLFLNRGGGKFEDVSAAWGVAIDGRYDSCAFADFDNDGHIDLYVNGTVTGGTNYRDYLFRNTGARFEDVTPENIGTLKADHGVQWADYDRDGAIDLALTGTETGGMHQLFRNVLDPARAAKALSVRVTDASGHDVCSGAEIRIYAAGTRRLVATRIVDTGSGYDSQNAGAVHVGVGDAARVDVEVIIAGTGRRALTRVANVDVRAQRGRDLVVRTGAR
jgi:penicillin G amidase